MYTKMKNISFEATYDQYSDMLYRIALTHLEREADAEDVVHDVFLKYYHKAREFRDEEHKKAWLIRVTINQCHDMRKSIRQRDYAELDEAKHIVMKEDNHFELFDVLSAVEEKYRNVIVLFYLNEMSVEEISRTLGISVSAVKMRLKRGREKLKVVLGKENYDV